MMMITVKKYVLSKEVEQKLLSDHSIMAALMSHVNRDKRAIVSWVKSQNPVLTQAAIVDLLAQATKTPKKRVLAVID